MPTPSACRYVFRDVVFSKALASLFLLNNGPNVLLYAMQKLAAKHATLHTGCGMQMPQMHNEDPIMSINDKISVPN